VTQNDSQAQAHLAPDMLKVFTGVSSQQVVDAVRALAQKRGDLEAEVVERLTRYPMETLAGFLLGTSAAFYLAERNVNPKVKTYVDALYYISTCLSVGYADIFAQTQTGRAVATLVMTIGPSLASNSLERPGNALPASVQGQEIIVERLDAILEELRKKT
jgi:hypothetical protein